MIRKQMLHSRGLKYLLYAFMLTLIQACSHEEETVVTYDPTEENRFTKTILSGDLDEPTEFAILPNKKILVVERKGDIKLWDPDTENLETINSLAVYSGDEDGLMGVALDPNFKYNRWVYLYYSPTGNESKQHLSRFVMKGNRLDLDSEVIMLVVPTQREECCHTGGSIQFGPDGLLYLSTGDDTNPFESDGYSPADQRPGRKAWDAQRSSANTMDLRGKILRIQPESDGTYSIPEGNLFPVGTPGTRPEIYVMGCRNPYRISIDQRRNWLFWGEVGPDAGNNSETRGPRGHDEVNVAKEAGFFGWPLFVGDNKAYGKYDFARRTVSQKHDANAPINNSPNNTGIELLPPAQPALIWYPYAASEEFSMLGQGGRNAMAGPVFYRDDYEAVSGTFPSAFDGKLFIYDWIRGWIFLVTLNEDGSLESLQPFMPNTQFNYMIDMEMGPDGALYILEYGTGWFTKNDDAAIVRIEYNPGNRKPTLLAQANKLNGGVPLTIDFSASGSFDYDNDKLYYTWEIDGKKYKSESTKHTFERPGIYYPKITVMDKVGNKVSQQFKVSAGNDVPKVKIKLAGNTSFHWPGSDIQYEVMVNDTEDGSISAGIDPASIDFNIEYIKEGLDLTEASQKGHQIVSRGLRLIGDSDCQSCHKLNEKSIGPSYTQVALRYNGQPNAIEFLSNKVINGGGGNWGEQAMAAHPSLSQEDAEEMVRYILSVADVKEEDRTPLSGTHQFVQEQSMEATYVFNASYTDRGAMGMDPIEGTDRVILKSPFVQAESYSEAKNARIFSNNKGSNHVYNIYDGSYLKYENIDFTDIRSLSFLFLINATGRVGGEVEVRVDQPDGPVLGTAEFSVTGRPIVSMPIDQEGRHDLYLVFKNKETPKEQMFSLDWIYFSKLENPGTINF